ncbi:glycosyltransferase [Flavobacterium sedimenticola]|uniref:Glycosyltransferase n=1 Tax=Flavobacterium sedimenticola TaxID=3043286 RepID=A0ABT6XS83_9FLAO|nr:glycosyltransferase [Flavobacterium sedimenticola]MDI9257702.1 glycosyltransferase [Flavobacterium sedimenticola]
MPIALIIPSFTAGGAERVMATLANHFQNSNGVQVHLIILTGGDLYYALDKDITVHQPTFDYKRFGRFTFTLKILFFLRQTLRLIKPQAALSFGGKYNAFVLLASIGLGINVFISERSRPGISYGRFLDAINPLVYKLASGIIAQTEKAQQYLFQKTKHPAITVIGNPIKTFDLPSLPKKNVILNVGRFIPTKNQLLLVQYFNEVAFGDWELWFLGDGPMLNLVKEQAAQSPKASVIRFFENQKDIEKFYQEAAVFAFTSVSEGFPNALGEAMGAGCACISFDCTAGPSDLIDHGENGFLIPLADDNLYRQKLLLLMQHQEVRQQFGVSAQAKIKQFASPAIATQYFNFMTR